jgi:hypothetical protein
MEYYVIKHVATSVEDRDVSIDFKIFDCYDSAKNYFDIKKETIIIEYVELVSNLENKTYTWESLKNDPDYEDDLYVDEEDIKQGDERYPYFSCDLEDYGSDKIYISKEPVMKFES